MRVLGTVLALLVAGPALAQVVSPLGGSTTNPQSPPPATAAPAAPSGAAVSGTPVAPLPQTTHRKTFAERFAAANTTKDGKLTLEQARAGHMRSIVRDFAQIDKDKRGYVTLDQVKAHQAEMRASHKRAASTTH